MKLYAHIIISLICASCIGTDVLDDVIVPETLAIEETSVVLQIGESRQLSAKYTDQYNIEKDVVLNWESSNEIAASVSASGLVSGLARGQAEVTVSFNSLVSEPVIVTVVEDVNDVAEVQISSPTSMIIVGESIQLNVTVYNYLQEEITDTDITWEVSNESYATINNTGLLTGLSDGAVQVTASADGIKSIPLTIMIGTEARVGTFVGANGYNSEGTAILYVNSNDEVILELSEDFNASFALGTFIYLANSTNGATVKGGGLDLGEITSGGAKTFNVSSLDPTVNLDTYRYCVVLCKPAAITFGYADFNEE